MVAGGKRSMAAVKLCWGRGVREQIEERKNAEAAACMCMD